MRPTLFRTASLTEPKEISRFATINFENLLNAINGNLSLRDNFNGVFKAVEFEQSNTNVTVTHDLGRRPSGYMITKLSAAMIVYDGSVDSTTDEITLRASAVGSARIFIF